MKKWIRWKGILPFAVIIILTVLFWTLLVDMIAERTLEALGTAAVGAKVEIDKTDVTLFPTGMRLARIQVTNPDAPMTNVAEITGMHLALDTVGLLKRKVIINEMNLDILRFNTPRKTSGAIKGEEKKGGKTTIVEKSETLRKILEKAGCGRVELPGLTTPDLKKILDNENLESLKMAEKFQKELSAEKARMDKTLRELPDEKKFNEYKKKIEKLQKKKASLSSMLTTASDATAIQKEIKTDIDHIKKAIKNYDKQLKAYQHNLSQLKKAPLKDIQRLKNKYAFSAKGLANMSRTLMGPQFCTWWEKGWGWYQRGKPYIEKQPRKTNTPQTTKPLRGKGLDVKFKEDAPLPDFLLRFARMKVVTNFGDITGVLENITTQPALVGRPVTFKFLGQKMIAIQSLSALGEIDLIRPEHPKSKLDVAIKALELNNIVFSETGPIPISMKFARTDMAFDFSLDGNKLDSRLNAGFNSVKMTSGAMDARNTIVRVLNNALGSANKFDVRAAAQGTVADFDLKITSDLDKTLKSAVGKMIQKEAAAFAGQLEKSVMTQIAGPLNQAQTGLDTLGPVGKELKKRLNTGESLLESELFKSVKLPF